MLLLCAQWLSDIRKKHLKVFWFEFFFGFNFSLWVGNASYCKLVVHSSAVIPLQLSLYSLLHSNIMAATNLLPPPPRVRHASSVAEWLTLLHLDHLAAKFSDYTLEKLSTLLDIELASVRPSLSYLTRGSSRS